MAAAGFEDLLDLLVGEWKYGRIGDLRGFDGFRGIFFDPIGFVAETKERFQMFDCFLCREMFIRPGLPEQSQFFHSETGDENSPRLSPNVWSCFRTKRYLYRPDPQKAPLPASQLLVMYTCDLKVGIRCP